MGSWKQYAGRCAVIAALFLAGAAAGGCGASRPSAPPAPPAEEVKTDASESVPRGQAYVRREAGVRYSVPESVSVLMYHMIGDIPGNAAVMKAENLKWQMQYLHDHGYHPITMEELCDYVTKGAALPEKPVCLTFDDGYADNYHIVYPLMKQYGYPWTLFVITGQVGQPNRVTWEQINEMADSRAVTIASHTVTHPKLHNLPLEEAKAEILGAQKALKEHAGINNPWIAYPYGDYDDPIIDFLQKTGIRMAVTTDAGRVHAGSFPYELKRVWIGNEVNKTRYAERLTKDDYTII